MTNSVSFQNEGERLQHPLAKLIPNEAWAKFFNNTLDEYCLTLMQIPSTELPLNALALQDLSLINKKKALIAILVSHPQLTALQLEELEKIFLPGTDVNVLILEVAIYAKNDFLINLLIRDYDSIDLFEIVTDARIYAAINDTKCYLALDVFRQCEPHFWVSALHYNETFISAARKGDLDTIRYLNENEITLANPFLDYLLFHTSSQQLKAVEKMMINDAFKEAADAKHVIIIQYLIDFYGDRLAVILNASNHKLLLKFQAVLNEQVTVTVNGHQQGSFASGQEIPPGVSIQLGVVGIFATPVPEIKGSSQPNNYFGHATFNG